jgi:hypothetical protein
MTAVEEGTVVWSYVSVSSLHPVFEVATYRATRRARGPGMIWKKLESLPYKLSKKRAKEIARDRADSAGQQYVPNARHNAPVR